MNNGRPFDEFVRAEVDKTKLPAGNRVPETNKHPAEAPIASGELSH